MEMQLQILQHCLVAEHHIMDFSKGSKSPVLEPHVQPQKDLALNIVFTCRTYHKEGWKIFFQENKFMYTSLQSLQFSMDGLYLTPKSMFTIRHLALRLLEKDHTILVNSFTTILEVCDLFKSLETLHVHIQRLHDITGWLDTFSLFQARGIDDSVARACKWYTWRTEGATYEDNEWVISSVALWRNLPENPSHSLAPHDPTQFEGRIKEILLTGLPGDDWKLEPLLVRLLSTMLSPGGQFGIGKGLEGIQYYGFMWDLTSYQWAKLMRKPQIEWVEASDVDRWIRSNGYRGKPLVMHEWMSRLFWEVDKNHPFFKGWI